MTSFTIGTDGMNVQRLRNSNLKPGATTAVTPVAATRHLHKTAGAPQIPQKLTLQQRIEKRRFIQRRGRLMNRIRNRRMRNRRIRNRRNQDLPVILDTRDYHDRRRSFQRTRDKRERDKSSLLGVDVVV